MMSVTVPGAGYTGKTMIPPAETKLLIALEIARALELEAYAAMRKAFHHHETANTATSAAEHDTAVLAWHEAVNTRDAAEQRRNAK